MRHEFHELSQMERVTTGGRHLFKGIQTVSNFINGKVVELVVELPKNANIANLMIFNEIRISGSTQFDLVRPLLFGPAIYDLWSLRTDPPSQISGATGLTSGLDVSQIRFN